MLFHKTITFSTLIRTMKVQHIVPKCKHDCCCTSNVDYKLNKLLLLFIITREEVYVEMISLRPISLRFVAGVNETHSLVNKNFSHWTPKHYYAFRIEILSCCYLFLDTIIERRRPNGQSRQSARKKN